MYVYTCICCAGVRVVFPGPFFEKVAGGTARYAKRLVLYLVYQVCQGMHISVLMCVVAFACDYRSSNDAAYSMYIRGTT